MNKPSVSVVICTYNGAKYLREQLDSILRQDYPAAEIIAQDDASTDGTMDILSDYARRYPQLKVFRNASSLGVNRNFFSAMRRATGDYIAISDQDDRWLPNKLSAQLQAIGDKLLCACHSRPFSDNGAYAHYDPRLPNTSLIRLLFNSLPGHTLLFRKELLTDIMPRDNELYHVSYYDVALCLAAAAKDSIAFADEALVDHRRHTSAATYSDFHHSLPGVGNFLYILFWSLRHYRQVRPKACRYWHARLAYLSAIPAETEVHQEAIRLLQLELRPGPWAALQLQCHLLRNRHRLFHTPGSSPVKWVRAALYPLMQYYVYR